MSGGQVPEKRYTDQQVRAVLARAAELQVSKGSGDLGSGTSLQQLEQAATELGLDAALVRQAAAEIGSEPARGDASWLLGGPWNVDSDRIVQGRVTAENWPGIVEDIRAATGRVGVAKDSGGLFEWTSGTAGLHISISPVGENSRVRVMGRFGELPMCMYFASSFGGLLLGCMLSLSLSRAAGLGPVAIVCLIAAMTAVGFLLARVGFCLMRRSGIAK